MSILRLNDQIAYHSKKARDSKVHFTRLQIIIIVAGSVVPLINVSPDEFLPFSTRIASAFLVALIAIITSIIGLYKYEENWYNYRKIAESLKKEKFLFMFDVGEYSGKQNEEKNKLFVQKIETLLTEADTGREKKS
jgi:hypothetical protein